MLTESEVQALGRAIDDLPKRAWDGFVATAKAPLESINIQVTQQAAIPDAPPPMPRRPIIADEAVAATESMQNGAAA